MGEVTVRVPATSANLGPGFDCFGCALTMYNTLGFRELDAGLAFEGCAEEYQNENNLAIQGYRAVLDRLGVPMRGLRLRIEAEVPICRGLGSSSALLLGGALAANALHGSPLSREELLTICTAIEGHPDNLAPAIYGGLTVSMMAEGKPVTILCPISERLRFVALIPDFEFPTEEARAVLPPTLTYSDAVFNVSHGAILLRALQTGDAGLLRMAMADRLHEPYRNGLIRGSETARRAAEECGSIAFALSGAGPTFLCIADNDSFGARIRERLGRELPGWQVAPLRIDQKGARILRS